MNIELRKRSVIAATLGNAVEWYDFTLFGAMATMIAKLFFPTGSPATALIYTFGIFGSGFFMRPIGGVIFGHIGDKLGRRTALIWSITLISIPIFLMGCLPTAAAIGIWAPILLTVLRLVQGLSVGGEFTGSMCFLVEVAPHKRRGLFGSLALMGVLCGVLLGAAVLAIVTAVVPSSSMMSWGWRLPFWIGGLFGFVVMILRRQLPESEDFEHEKADHHLEKIPLLEAVTHHLPDMIRSFLMTAMLGVGFYIVMFYMRSYFTLGLGFSATVANTFFLCGAALLLLVTPLAGRLSDRFGYKWVMGSAAIGFLILSWPLVKWQLASNSLPVFLATQGLIILFLACYGGPLGGVLPSQFETRYRYSGLSVSYNLSQAAFGASAPLVAALLVRHSNDYSTLAWVLMGGALLSLMGLFTARDLREA